MHTYARKSPGSGFFSAPSCRASIRSCFPTPAFFTRPYYAGTSSSTGCRPVCRPNMVSGTRSGHHTRGMRCKHIVLIQDCGAGRSRPVAVVVAPAGPAGRASAARRPSTSCGCLRVPAAAARRDTPWCMRLRHAVRLARVSSSLVSWKRMPVYCIVPYKWEAKHPHLGGSGQDGTVV